jgi:hypothetical protein
MLHAGLLLRLFFLRNVGSIYVNYRVLYSRISRILHNDRCENLKSYRENKLISSRRPYIMKFTYDVQYYVVI